MTDVFWDRIEPHTRDVGLEEGLQSRLADPLWMLARQWQVGEFRGEDAASPIHARLTVEHSPITSFRNDAAPRAQPEPFRAGRPLESRVEAERVEAGPARLGLAAEAGLGLLRRLDAAGLGHLRAPLRRQFPLQPAPEDTVGLPAREARRLRLLVRGSIDAAALLAADPTAAARAVPAAARARLREVLEAWRAELGALVDRPGDSGETWVEDRLEHSVSLAAPTEDGEVVLSAAEYPGGHLDWHSFDVGGARPHGLEPAEAQRRTLDRLPVPLAYAGMPRSRFWELEEGSVYFGGIEAGPADIGRLVVAEYATVYSDDWFLIPVRFPTGSLARVVRAHVHNTFGERHEVRSAAQWDHEAGGERGWAFCELSGDPSAAAGETPYLLLLPTLADSQGGRPLESVSFVRDEAANLAWAVEQRVETATGGTVRRRLQWALAEGAGTEASADAADAEAELADAEPGPADAEDPPWRYRLQSPVPPHWIPLVPERPAEGSPEVVLRRGRMLAWDELDEQALVGAQGRLLTPERPFRLHEEEIPRTGVEVTRAWQLARGADGRLHAWMARRKRPGRGERGSGLRHDTTERP